MIKKRPVSGLQTEKGGYAILQQQWVINCCRITNYFFFNSRMVTDVGFTVYTKFEDTPFTASSTGATCFGERKLFSSSGPPVRIVAVPVASNNAPFSLSCTSCVVVEMFTIFT